MSDEQPSSRSQPSKEGDQLIPAGVVSTQDNNEAFAALMERIAAYEKSHEEPERKSHETGMRRVTQSHRRIMEWSRDNPIKAWTAFLGALVLSIFLTLNRAYEWHFDRVTVIRAEVRAQSREDLVMQVDRLREDYKEVTEVLTQVSEALHACEERLE